MKFSWALSSRIFGVLLCLLVFLNLNGGKNHWQGIPEADARGYYAWLPAIFIYQDIHFSFMDSIEGKKYFNENLYYEYRVGYEGHIINKYFAGTAFVQIPFFMIGHLWAGISGEDQDGYSKPYLMMIGIAAVFWLMLGLFWTDKLMMLYGFSDGVRALSLMAFLFGTNLFYYAVVEPGMSHVYSFALFAGVFYFLKQYQNKENWFDCLKALFLLGLAIVVRPVNGIFLFALPFVAGGWKPMLKLFQPWLKRPGKLLTAFCIFALFPLIQIYLHWLQTGAWGILSYPNEHFNFLKPEIINILFSYKKGLFLYSPLYLGVITFGIYSWIKPNRIQNISWFFLFWFVQLWVFSSWWCWWYGGSFSGRPFLDFGVFIILILAAGIEWLLSRNYGKIITSLLLLILVGFCQFQIYQYRYYLIHWEDMTQEKYWEVFLKLP